MEHDTSNGDQSIQLSSKTANQSKDLCDVCKQIAVKASFQSPSGVNGCEVLPLGFIDEKAKTSRCPLCQLLASLAPQLRVRCSANRKRQGYHLRAFSGISKSKKWNDNDRSIAGRPEKCFAVCEWLSDSSFGPRKRQLCFARGVIAPVGQESQSASSSQVLLVNRHRADFSQMREWLQKCQSSHGTACTVEERTPIPGLKVIDCVTRQIIKADTGLEYFVLSYVWGAVCIPKFNTVDANSQLPAVGEIPRSIRDAIEVVQQLGGRYLWVDQYCIDQTNAVEKHTQIRNMDKIYENAMATIIAASGEDATCGLAGVSERPRVQQPTVMIENQLFASTFPDISIPISASVWATRGWTYQEAVVSRRCFYFTDNQVYFACRAMTCCETLSHHIPSAQLTPSEFRTDIFDNNLSAAGRKKTGLWQFFDHLYYYKLRQLSYDSDALNAFHGLLSRMPYLTLWGVPIARRNKDDPDDENTYCRGFLRGLWWENPGDPWIDETRMEETIEPFQRCHGFPSWSWTGWRGPIRRHAPRRPEDYLSDTCNLPKDSSDPVRVWARLRDGTPEDDLSDTWNQPKGSSGSVRIWPQLRDGTVLSLRDLCERRSELKGTSELSAEVSPVLWMEADVVKLKFRPDSTYSSSVAYICDCKADTQCQGRKKHAARTYSVRFFEDVTMDTCIKPRLFTEEWDAIKLFLCGYFVCTLLIIDWKDNIARVIGVVYCHVTIIGGKSERKKFQLG